MRTWNDYKVHVEAVDPEMAKDIREAEAMSAIVKAMVEQRNALGLSQRLRRASLEPWRLGLGLGLGLRERDLRELEEREREIASASRFGERDARVCL